MLLANGVQGIDQGRAQGLFQQMMPFVNGFMTVIAAILVVYTIIAFARVGYQYMTQPDDPNIKMILVDTVRNVVIGWVIVVVAVAAARIVSGVAF
ncbi:MAG: hypothetical protein BSOLF_0527 [Candidatus Carbobacillus altaicus]|uniref:Uncharacterized protein n=1 Tax=Candidatus Carbonibacillus altaicus TaxID=2163959 RepID=A0A2R6Y0Q7_9BACL|nr:MAG: hypothetical protein BSOLF_0527 [Candidatus Carbobacillus altaicus]